MEERAARWGGLCLCRVLTQEGRPRLCQTGRGSPCSWAGLPGPEGPSPAITYSYSVSWEAQLLCQGSDKGLLIGHLALPSPIQSTLHCSQVVITEPKSTPALPAQTSPMAPTVLRINRSCKLQALQDLPLSSHHIQHALSTLYS